MKKDWPQGRLAIIQWEDTTHWGRWEHIEEWTDRVPESCETVAWVLPSPKETLVCFGTRTSGGEVGDRRVFPRGCVRKVIYLVDRPPTDKPARKGVKDGP